MSSVDALPLSVELVPSTSWYRNVRANVSLLTWDSLQRFTFLSARQRCEICGGVGHRHPVECHEVWRYDDTFRVQTLERLIALCPRCHSVKHLGLLLAQGRPDRTEEALRWLCEVNSISPDAALAYVAQAFSDHATRSQNTYRLDVSYLRRLGVDIDPRGIELGHTPTGIDY